MLTNLYCGFAAWKTNLVARLKDEEGATAVEYGIMVAFIAAIIIGLVVILGQYVAGAFDQVNDSMNTNNVPKYTPPAT